MLKNYELYAIIGALIFFYLQVLNSLRINWVKERREKKLLAEGKIKKHQLTPKKDPRLWLKNLSKKNTTIILIGVGLMLVGTLARDNFILPIAQPYWWIMVSLGIVILSFGLDL
jgi:hypothetical protein